MPWLVDVAKSAGINAVFAGIGGAVALRWCAASARRWWIPASALIVLFGVVTIWLFPVVIDPLFNDFEQLPPGQARSDVLELADKAGVDVGEVYRVDASRRTTAANAYVIGLGHSKRVVLYDNLLDGFPRDEVRSVVAHELGHQKHDDLLRGLAWLALVAPAGAFCAQRAGGGVRTSSGARRSVAQGRPGGAAGDRAGGDAGLVRARPGVERALAPGRGARRRVLDRAHPRSRGAHLTRAPAGAAQPLRSGPAEPVPGPVRHPPDDAGADRDAARPTSGASASSCWCRCRRWRRCPRGRTPAGPGCPRASATWRSCPPSRRSARA